MNAEPRDDLNWRAFRYVAAELSAAETADFESRLADDPAACDAVARAVELAQAMRAAGAGCAVAKRNHGRRSAMHWAVGVAACAAALLLAVGLLQRLILDSPGPDRSTDGGEPAALAIAWCDVQRALREQEPEAAEPVWAEAAAEDDSEADENATPDWMFTAVVDLEAASPAAAPRDLEDI